MLKWLAIGSVLLVGVAVWYVSKKSGGIGKALMPGPPALKDSPLGKTPQISGWASSVAESAAYKECQRRGGSQMVCEAAANAAKQVGETVGGWGQKGLDWLSTAVR